MNKKLFVAAFCVLGSEISVGQTLQAQNPVERRADRNTRQLQRQALRLGNRTPYYNDNVWKQVSPWVSQYNVPPYRPLANAAANAANAAANVAANAVNRRFGFVNPNATATTSWFYDYYSLPPTNYVLRDDVADSYSSAHRYYDHNNDGIYDGYYTYRDVNKDGKYDEYDRYDFGDSKDDDLDNDPPYDAHRHTVHGKVDAIKNSKVNGSPNVVVRIVSSNQESMIVDLGSQSGLKEGTVKVGTELTASGPVVEVGDKQVLIAETVRVANTDLPIMRYGNRLDGTIVDISYVDAPGGKHAFAVIKTDQGNQLVDLGSSASFDSKFEPNTKIIVYGGPVQMRDRQVVLAEQIEVNGKRINIKRW